MTIEEIGELERLLSKLEPGVLPYSVFNQISRVFVSSIMDIAPLRELNGTIQILLTKREKTDPFWPDMWHVPGTVLRATDTKGSFEDAFVRVLGNELGCNEYKTPVFVDVRFSQSTRGSEFSAMYCVEILGATNNGEWFGVDNLPNGLIESQKELVEKTVEAFKKRVKI